MKHFIILISLFVFFTGALHAQDDYCPTCRKKDAQKPYFDLNLGYVPKTQYNAGKASLAINNIFYKRFGLYTSFEKGLNNTFFSNIIGGTATVYRTIYLFGGFDWFTSNQGVFYHKSIIKARKELGVGFSLFKYGTVRYGYSFQIGHSFSAGVKVPFISLQKLHSRLSDSW